MLTCLYLNKAKKKKKVKNKNKEDRLNQFTFPNCLYLVFPE